MSATREITDSNFQSQVLDSDIAFLVLFTAPWCGPCQKVIPLLEEIANESNGAYSIGTLDVDSNAGVTGKYGARGIPLALVFKNGELKSRVEGVRQKQDYVAAIESAL